MLACGGLALYTFRGAFTALGDTATAAAEDATATVRENAVLSAAKSKVKVQAPGASAADIDNYRSDAATIAHALGTATGQTFSANWFAADDTTAFGVVKRYSRLMLYNNYPYDLKTHKKQTVATSSSAQRKVNWKVLAPFYKDETGGRDLAADLNKYLNYDKFQPTLKWIL